MYETHPFYGPKHMWAWKLNYALWGCPIVRGWGRTSIAAQLFWMHPLFYPKTFRQFQVQSTGSIPVVMKSPILLRVNPPIFCWSNPHVTCCQFLPVATMQSLPVPTSLRMLIDVKAGGPFPKPDAFIRWTMVYSPDCEPLCEPWFIFTTLWCHQT